MLPDIALQAMRPVIMTSSPNGQYGHNYVISLFNLLHDSMLRGLPLQVSLLRGEHLMPRARNNCVAQFLANPDWTHLFWIDPNIGFSAQAAYRLLLSDHDIAVGACPQEFSATLGDDLAPEMTLAQFDHLFTHYGIRINTQPEETTLVVQPDGFLEIDAALFGFTVIKRQVFEQLVAALPDYQYTPDSPIVNQGLHYRFFDTAIDPATQHYLTDDMAFCQLWQQQGGKIHLDANSNLTQQGSKLFTGNFAQSLVNDPARTVQHNAHQNITLEGFEFLLPNSQLKSE